MRVVSVDLAHTSYTRLGIVVFEQGSARLSVRRLAPQDLGLEGHPSSPDLAAALAEACERLSADTLILDGPQGWKHPDNGIEHSRVCERQLNTPGKTGLPGSVKPGEYLPFIEFSIRVFGSLVSRGFELWARQRASRLALESFPLSAWRAVSLPPLPAKAKARMEDLVQAAQRLRDLFALDVPDGLSHDELQAVVGGLAGVAVVRDRPRGYAVAGIAPTRVDGTWREGFVVNPTREALMRCG